MLLLVGRTQLALQGLHWQSTFSTGRPHLERTFVMLFTPKLPFDSLLPLSLEASATDSDWAFT